VPIWDSIIDLFLDIQYITMECENLNLRVANDGPNLLEIFSKPLYKVCVKLPDWMMRE